MNTRLQVWRGLAWHRALPSLHSAVPRMPSAATAVTGCICGAVGRVALSLECPMPLPSSGLCPRASIIVQPSRAERAAKCISTRATAR
jgi:hypothetical protein